MNRPGRVLCAVVLASLVCLAGAAVYWGGDEVLSAAARAARTARQAGPLALAAYLTAFTLVSAFVINSPVPLSAACKLLAGFLFGAVLGAVVNVSMTVLGAAFGFILVRRAFRDRFSRLAGSRLLAADAEAVRGGFWYVLSARLALVLPFSAVNLACGLSGMRIRDFLWGSFLGAIPISLFYAAAGAGLSDWSQSGVSPGYGFSLTLMVLAVLALIPPVAARFGWLPGLFRGRREGGCGQISDWGLPSGPSLANKSASPCRGSSVGRAGD